MAESSNLKNPVDIMQENSSGVLNFIFKKAAHLTRLNKLWQTEIAAPLSQHCRVANYRDGCLVIQVESSVWATQLRFSVPEIIEKLRRIPEFAGLARVEWYVGKCQTTA